MSIEENKALTHRFYEEVFNKRKNAMSNAAVLEPTTEVTQPDTTQRHPHFPLVWHIDPASTTQPIITNGWGQCRDWWFCGCTGYRGNGTQPCTCGHGFGHHF